MRTINLLIVIGNVGQDPRQVGRATKLNVATNRSWRDTSGERKTATDWVTVTCFGRTGEYVIGNVRKGDVVSIQAHVADSSYERDGLTHYSTDVIADRLDLVASRGGASNEE